MKSEANTISAVTLLPTASCRGAATAARSSEWRKRLLAANNRLVLCKPDTLLLPLVWLLSLRLSESFHCHERLKVVDGVESDNMIPGLFCFDGKIPRGP